MRKSFFWNGIFSCLPSFRTCTSPVIQNGANTLFWLDRWIDDRAPMYLWADLFHAASNPFITIQECLLYLPLPSSIVTKGRGSHSLNSRESKRWRLTSNGQFTSKFFYGFLNYRGILCPSTKLIWKNTCPRERPFFLIGLLGIIVF